MKRFIAEATDPSLHIEAQGLRLQVWIAPLLALLLVPALAQTTSQDRWVNATELQLRNDASPQAPILARLERGRRVRLLAAPAPAAPWCFVDAGLQTGYVACVSLSDQLVAAPKAGVGGVPAERRWVTGSNLLLRTEPRSDAPIAGRLDFNEPVRLSGADAGNGYCPVQQIQAAGLSGFTACRYLQTSPLAWGRISAAQLDDGRDNPEFDPARAFWIRPDWGLMAHYARRVQQQREALAGAAPKGPDEQLERMKARLSGEVVDPHETPPVWPDWQAIREDPASFASASLGLWSESFMEHDGQRVKAFVLALPALPDVAPSWWRGEEELAGPAESVQALATRFGARVQLLHESMLKGSPNRGRVEPGIRIERLTRSLHRVSLLATGALRDEGMRPEVASLDWDPTRDYNCPGWQPGFSHGDADASAYGRNGFEPPATTGAMTLFRFWSARPLPGVAARWTRWDIRLDREATGFVRAELRVADLDRDGIPDLAWLQAMGRGPGHLEGPPTHDDAWYRLLLANVAGRWRLLATDAFSYGCGC